MSRSAAIERELALLYDVGIDWRRAGGVVHVAAIGANPRGALAVGPGEIGSSTDRFILGFARARADAIVTTSAILRSEPALVHRTSEDPAEEEAWGAFRRMVLGRREEPELVVLSNRGELPRDHPALCRSGGVVVLTGALGRARLADTKPSFELVGLPDPPAEPGTPGGTTDPACRALSEAIRWLRDVRGAGTIVLEAGPRSAFGLYAGEASDGLARVDELLLTIFEGTGAAVVPGPTLPARAALLRHFAGQPAHAHAPVQVLAGEESPLRSEQTRIEASGPWRFERYRRADANARA